MIRPMQKNGFTILELLIVMAISGFVTFTIFGLFESYTTSFYKFTKYSSMGESLDVTLINLTSDLKDSLPNSARKSTAGGVTALEFLHVLDHGQYRVSQSSLGVGDPLLFPPSVTDLSFDVLGQLNKFSEIVVGTGVGDCNSGNAHCLVVANGVDGVDAYNGDNMVTITSVSDNTAVDGSDKIYFQNIDFTVGNVFPKPSPGQRFYIVDTPVTYICDISAGTLHRYWGYSLQANQTATDTHEELLALPNPAESALLSGKVTDCSFSLSASPPLVIVVMEYNDGHGTSQVFHQIDLGLEHE
jgi:MSHA biogenesis protein MshO